MTLTVVVDVDPSERAHPHAGARVVVQVRDTTYVDVPTPVVAEARATANDRPEGPIAAVQLELPADPPRHLGVWAHVDVDEDDKVSAGDYVSTAAYPVTISDALSPQPSARLGQAGVASRLASSREIG